MEEMKGKLNIIVNNKDKVRLSEKMMDTNSKALDVIQQVIQSNNKLNDELSHGNQVTVTNSQISSSGTGVNITTLQDDLQKVKRELELKDYEKGFHVVEAEDYDEEPDDCDNDIMEDDE